MADEEVTPLAGAAMSSLKALVPSRQDGVKRPRITGEVVAVETHLADADSAETTMMVVEDVVEVVVEEAVQGTASDAMRKVTWLEIALMRTRDLLGDPWSASSATRMVIWLENAQLVTVAAVVVTTTTRDHAVMPMMEAIPELRTEVETTMTTLVEVVEAVAGVELPTMTWTTLGARPTTTMLVMIGAVTVVIKVVE